MWNARCATCLFTGVTPGVTDVAMNHPLTEARKRAGYSQDALAKLIGRERMTILRIENGRTQPPLQTVSEIIAALREKNVELSADDFLPANSRDGARPMKKAADPKAAAGAN
jgi:DNA-binding XRE family transcriptional regulator